MNTPSNIAWQDKKSGQKIVKKNVQTVHPPPTPFNTCAMAKGLKSNSTVLFVPWIHEGGKLFIARKKLFVTGLVNGYQLNAECRATENML